MFLEIFIFFLVLGYFLYRWIVANNDFFEKRGIPYQKPIPMFGSMKDFILRKISIFDLIKELYFKHDGKVFGMFDLRCPVLLVRDPDLIKHITIKDFDNFVNHRPLFGENSSELFANSIFFLRNDKWRDMRNTLSPAFTGSKMRHMFELINQVAHESSFYLKELAKTKEGVEIDVKDFTTRFANDVIASTAFGLQVNSFKEQNNQFYRMGREVTRFTALQNLKFFCYANFEALMKFFNMKVIPQAKVDYFTRLVLDAMKYRKEHNITRPDMINMLMEARGFIESDSPKSHSQEWTDVEIVAQCFLFFFAGFEAVSVLVSFTAHELMENPDVQQRLYEEVEDFSRDLGNKPVSYEVLQNMKYMDMVVSETLRKWPAAVTIDRAASKDFVYVSEEGETIEIKQGDNIWIPVSGIHHDPKYFPNPEKYCPERFSDENKQDIVPFTYLPFGIGPRFCIGSRFALLEAKAMLFYLLRDFRIEAGKKTRIPIELLSNGFQLGPKHGFWLKFVPRTKK